MFVFVDLVLVLGLELDDLPDLDPVSQLAPQSGQKFADGDSSSPQFVQ
ncbi:hypothetical protein [Natronoglomus mannanivorans]|uniref:Uncharacterized protein n=1 Tax=Natronoglomus mannanivorans TaxID=2979990 RepID=A0AAP2YYU3_9EURY|nr:hypothetical protein [Halobacteria archaeon AArc-xg1-1]